MTVVLSIVIVQKASQTESNIFDTHWTEESDRIASSAARTGGAGELNVGGRALWPRVQRGGALVFPGRHTEILLEICIEVLVVAEPYSFGDLVDLSIRLDLHDLFRFLDPESVEPADEALAGLLGGLPAFGM
jgi:hypothetical protein